MVLTDYISSADKLSVVRSDSESDERIPKYYSLPNQLVDFTFLIKTLKLENPPAIQPAMVIGVKL